MGQKLATQSLSQWSHQRGCRGILSTHLLNKRGAQGLMVNNLKTKVKIQLKNSIVTGLFFFLHGGQIHWITISCITHCAEHVKLWKGWHHILHDVRGRRWIIIDILWIYCFLTFWPLLFIHTSIFVFLLTPAFQFILTSIHFLPLLLSLIHPYIPWIPGGQTTLTCICLAWMSPRFGLNAPIILLNYDVLLWDHVAPSLWRSYESWHGATEPFTEARLRARPHERFSPCNQPMESRRLVWRANHMDTLWPALKALPAVPGFI